MSTVGSGGGWEGTGGGVSSNRDPISPSVIGETQKELERGLSVKGSWSWEEPPEEGWVKRDSSVPLAGRVGLVVKLVMS